MANLRVFSGVKWCRCDGGHSQGLSDTFSVAPSPNKSAIIIHLGAADGLLLMESVDRQPSPRHVSPSAALCFFFLSLFPHSLRHTSARITLALSLSLSFFKMVKAGGESSELLLCCRIRCTLKKTTQPDKRTAMGEKKTHFTASLLLPRYMTFIKDTWRSLHRFPLGWEMFSSTCG